jgi:hypothetical protein
VIVVSRLLRRPSVERRAPKITEGRADLSHRQKVLESIYHRWWRGMTPGEAK